jgi:hypothetical protein
MANQRLNTNAFIPAIGFGCAADGSDQYEKILYALKVGYRSIDTAAMCVYSFHYNLTLRYAHIFSNAIVTRPKKWSAKLLETLAFLEKKSF